VQVLQLGRVKKIVKQASDVKAIANDANFAIARATVSLNMPGPCTVLVRNILTCSAGE